MENLSVKVKNGNLILELTKDRRGWSRQIVLNPAGKIPQLQYLSGVEAIKGVNYQRAGDQWVPIGNPAYETYKPGTLEHQALSEITEEARNVRNRVNLKVY